MKKHIFTFAFIFISVLSYAQWNFVGVAGISSSWSVENKLETDTLGHPVVVFYENILNKASCLRFNGTQWLSVGNPSLDNFPIASVNDFIIDSQNNYYLLFTNTNFELACIIYDGKTWKYVGSQKIITKQSVHSAMAIDSKGVVYVVHPTWGDNVIIVKENSGSWIPVSNSGLPSSMAFPSLKFDSKNVPYLAYTGGGFKVNCSKLVNGNWVAVGNSNISSNEVAAFYTTLHITNKDEIYIAFDDPKISCYKLDVSANTWKMIGASGLGGNYNGLNNLISYSDSRVYISTSQISGDKAMCFTFNGKDWVLVGKSPISESYASPPNISINKQGKIYAAYNDFNLSKAVVKEFSLTTSTGSLVQNDQLKVFPNPSVTHFFIELPGEKFMVTIQDTSGKLIAEYQNIHNKVGIDSKTFRKGSYIVGVRTQNHQHHYRKLIIN